MAKTTRTTRKRAPLSRDRIMITALQLIEEQGLEDFSLRKLAQALQCEAMSLYHHFPSKAQLLDALVDSVLGEMTFAPVTETPVERMRFAARAYRGLALRHPRFFQYLALHRTDTDVGIRFLHSILDILFAAGLDAETSARLFRAFGYYLTGAALDETGGYAKGPSAENPVPDEVILRDYPHVARVGAYFKPEHFEATFELGLEIFLAGMAAEIARQPTQN